MGEQSGRIFRDMKTHHLSLLDIRRTIDIIITYLLMLTTIMVNVHTNSSIINKVAYLIASGGNHNGVNVHGIGEDKMFDISIMQIRMN